MAYTLQVVLSGFKSAFLPFHVKQAYLRKVSEELRNFGEESAVSYPPGPPITHPKQDEPAQA